LPIADFVLPSGILTLSRVVTIVEGRKLAIGNRQLAMKEIGSQKSKIKNRKC